MQRQWECTETEAQCRCNATDPDLSIDFISSSGSKSVARCDGYGCCLIWEPPDEPGRARCECFEPAGSCEAEAASRRDTEVVPACPPNGEQAPVKCADPGENCTSQYLFDHDLEGCCEGLLCKANDGPPVCTAASAEELALDAECRKAEVGDEPVIVQPLQTNSGPFALDSIRFSNGVFGPAGCLVSFNMTLRGGGGCYLEISVGPEKTPEGRFMVREETSCLLLTSPVEGSLAFDGVSCLNPLKCHTGLFDLRLTSPPPPPSTDPVFDPSFGKRSLTGEPFVLDGSFCDFGEVVATCP